MSRQLSADELDDADYRARLAPLAKSVLPRAAQPPSTPIRRRPLVTIAAATACAAVLLAGTWLYVPWPRAVPVPAAMPERHAAAQATNTLLAQKPAAAQTETLIGILLDRGNAAMAHSDITAARLLFQCAAEAGSAEAAHALGTTYDVQSLLDVGARPTDADPALAARWYRRAAELSTPDTAKRSSPGNGTER